MSKIRILTRDSFLALAQTLKVSQYLMDRGVNVDVIAQKTHGDIKLDAPLYEVSSQASQFPEKEGKAFFTKELEDGLLNKTGDLAVHSLKDLPTDIPPGLAFAGPILPEKRSDTIVSLRKLPEDPGELNQALLSSEIGTSSLRRIAVVKDWLPDAKIEPLRGNLVTRLEKLLASKTMDFLVLATAGLERLFAFFYYWKKERNNWLSKLPEELVEKLDSQYARVEALLKEELYFYEVDDKTFLPAVSQGVLGLETREDNAAEVQALFPADEELDQRILLERRLLSALEAGCHVPFGIHVERRFKSEKRPSYYEILFYFAKDFMPDTGFTKKPFFARRNLSDASASAIFELCTREVAGEKFGIRYVGVENPVFEEVCRKHGFSFQHIPLIQVQRATQDASALADEYPVAIVVSKSAVEHIPETFPAITRWVAVGKKTAAELKKRYPDAEIFVPEVNTGLDAAFLAQELFREQMQESSQSPHETPFLWLGAANGRTDGVEYLQESGWKVDRFTGYETAPKPVGDTISEKLRLDELLEQPGYWVFTSPSTARSYLEQKLHRQNHLLSVIGETTAGAFFEKDIIPYHIATKSDLTILADELAGIREIKSVKLTQWSISHE